MDTIETYNSDQEPIYASPLYNIHWSDNRSRIMNSNYKISTAKEDNLKVTYNWISDSDYCSNAITNLRVLQLPQRRIGELKENAKELDLDKAQEDTIISDTKVKEEISQHKHFLYCGSTTRITVTANDELSDFLHGLSTYTSRCLLKNGTQRAFIDSNLTGLGDILEMHAHSGKVRDQTPTLKQFTTDLQRRYEILVHKTDSNARFGSEELVKTESEHNYLEISSDEFQKEFGAWIDNDLLIKRTDQILELENRMGT